MQNCWPLAYNIHAIGELIGFCGLLMLFVFPGYLIFIAIRGEFMSAMWLLLVVPFGMGLLSEVMVQVSWKMVDRRGFQYDYEKSDASWIEYGQRVTYRYGQDHSEESPPDERPSAT